MGGNSATAATAPGPALRLFLNPPARNYRLMAVISREFTLTRAQKTCAVATAIAGDWVWDERTVAQLVAAKAATEGMFNQLATAEAATNAKRGTADAEGAKLHTWTVKVLGLARIRFRNEPAKLRAYAGLSARADSRAAISAEARELLGTWTEIEPAGTHNLGNGLTLTRTMFETQYRLVEGNDDVVPAVPGAYDALDAAVQLERKKAETLNTALEGLASVMEAWYAAATATWDGGTTIGDQVRGQIPTTYDPANPPLPLPPTPEGVAAGAGPNAQELQGVCLPNAITVEYQWVLTLPGQSPDKMSITTTTNGVLFTDVPLNVPGTLTVTALNATGASAPSAPVDVLLT